MKRGWKRALQLAVSVVLTVVVTSALYFARYGVPLFDAPKPEEVSQVLVEMATGDGEGRTKVLTSPEDIETACKLMNFMNYNPFTPVNACQDPIVTVTYVRKDGRELTAAANRYVGWWNGRLRALMQEELFVNLAEGLFLD